MNFSIAFPQRYVTNEKITFFERLTVSFREWAVWIILLWELKSAVHWQ